MSEGLVIETLYEVSIVFRKESFINAKKVLNFIQSLSYKWKESNKAPNGVPYPFAFPQGIGAHVQIS